MDSLVVSPLNAYYIIGQRGYQNKKYEYIAHYKNSVLTPWEREVFLSCSYRIDTWYRAGGTWENISSLEGTEYCYDVYAPLCVYTRR